MGDGVVKWSVEITETLQASVEIEAESEEDAERQARNMYRHCDIVLGASNCVDVAFAAQQ
ncbi:MAG: DpnD/PcfM family protein [Kiritimatiellae bacterium]|nr:DpnD/PcfM family protein [Kiritimatiellia bacterium]MBR3923529.1 DpnD/PcfM family protein [Kiritimatiellia bacterium]